MSFCPASVGGRGNVGWWQPWHRQPVALLAQQCVIKLHPRSTVRADVLLYSMLFHALNKEHGTNVVVSLFLFPSFGW